MMYQSPADLAAQLYSHPKLAALKLGGSGSASGSGSGSGSRSSSSLKMAITPLSASSSVPTGPRPGSTSPVSPGAGAGALSGPPSTTTLQTAGVLGAPAIPGAGAGAGGSGPGGIKQQQPRNWNVISPPILANPKCSGYFVEPVGVLRSSLIFASFVFFIFFPSSPVLCSLFTSHTTLPPALFFFCTILVRILVLTPTLLYP
jgi:hypothetical protein